MTKMSSTMLSVGTLLRRAEDTGSEVRVLVQGCWLDGRVIGCDGLGAVLDDGNDQQVLVRLDSVVAVTFSRAHLDADLDGTRGGSRDGSRVDDAWTHGSHEREPIEAGPVRVPSQASGGFEFIPARQR